MTNLDVNKFDGKVSIHRIFSINIKWGNLTTRSNSLEITFTKNTRKRKRKNFRKHIKKDNTLMYILVWLRIELLCTTPLILITCILQFATHHLILFDQSYFPTTKIIIWQQFNKGN